MSEGDFWPNTSLVQTLVRPGRIIASPIAMWRPEPDPQTMAITYWSPTTQPGPEGTLPALEPPT